MNSEPAQHSNYFGSSDPPALPEAFETAIMSGRFAPRRQWWAGQWPGSKQQVVEWQGLNGRRAVLREIGWLVG